MKYNISTKEVQEDQKVMLSAAETHGYKEAIIRTKHRIRS